MLNDEHKILIKEFQSESIERKQLVKQQLVQFVGSEIIGRLGSRLSSRITIPQGSGL